MDAHGKKETIWRIAKLIGEIFVRVSCHFVKIEKENFVIAFIFSLLKQ